MPETSSDITAVKKAAAFIFWLRDKCCSTRMAVLGGERGHVTDQMPEVRRN